MFIRYEKDIEINKKLSLICDGRMIWGGDKTAYEFKNYQTKIKSSDIFFNDKYSISLINSDELFKIKNSKHFDKFIENFYNDTLLMDQNACSSPHLILWNGKKMFKSPRSVLEIFFKIYKKKIQIRRYCYFRKINSIHAGSYE